MDNSDTVTRTIDVLVQNPDAGFDALREILQREGLSPTETTRALEFIPLAFGRNFLGGMGVQFPDTYRRVDASGREVVRKKLVFEPLFMDAAMRAPLVLMKQGQDAYMAVVLRSSEVQAVNEALNAGSDPKDLVAAEPVMLADETPAKPWWKFW
jgi:hypothetical protein